MTKNADIPTDKEAMKAKATLKHYCVAHVHGGRCSSTCVFFTKYLDEDDNIYRLCDWRDKMYPMDFCIVEDK